MNQVFLPQYTIGTDAYQSIKDITASYGHTAVIVYGEKGYQAAKDKLLPALNNAGIEILDAFCYGKEATLHNAQAIVSSPAVQQADFLLAAGAGKCIDTVKTAAHLLRKPMFSLPTLASNCAPITEISILYDDRGVYADTVSVGDVIKHTFIDTEIIAASPDCYFQAGIGDTLAKYIEASFSAKGDTLNYRETLGLQIAPLCYEPVLACGVKAMQAKKEGKPSEELETVIQTIIVSTGLVSILMGQNYNTALAHALTYGFSNRTEVKNHHLHGDIVAYGVLVQLLVDHQKDYFEREFAFHKELGLPTKLKDLDILDPDHLEDVLNIAVHNKGMEHVPYTVSEEMIKEAMKYLEDIQK